MPEPAVSRFILSVKRSGDFTLVTCSGRLVAGPADNFFREMKELMPVSKQLTLDFAEVTHIDSSGIGALVRLYLAAKSSGTTFQITNIGNSVRQLLGISRVLSMFESPAEKPKPVAKRAFGSAGSLEGLFNPKTVALVAGPQDASPVADQVFSTFLNGEFRGTTFVVQPGQSTYAGHACYSTLRAIPSPVDLAVVAAPPEAAPDIVAACADQQVKGVLLISNGFGANGHDSSATAATLHTMLAGSQTRVIGPHALGVMNPLIGLNATPGLHMPIGGTVAFLSQSAMLGRSVLEWSWKHIVGFSTFACLGDMLDVSWANIIDYFGRDPQTRTIMLQMSSLGDARSFLSAAREVALDKPIIVIKAGQNQDSLRALCWQSKAVVSDAAVLRAAFDRVGVLQVDTLEDLFYAADALSKQPRPRGPSLMLLSNADIPGVLAADSVARCGVKLVAPSDETRAELEPLMVRQSALDDAMGDGTAESYLEAVRIAAADPHCDGLLLLVVPWAVADPQKAAEALMDLHNVGKPILLSYLGTAETPAAHDALVRACIPTFTSPEAAARVFQYMWRYSYDLQAIYVTPMGHAESEEGSRDLVQAMIADVRKSGRSSLTPDECNQVLTAYGIRTQSDGVFPFSDTVGFRAKLGSRIDPQFGPILMFGSADRGPNVYGDLVIGLPPLNANLARRVLDGSDFYRAILRQTRSQFHAGLMDLLVRFSDLVVEQPWIKSFEISTLLVSGEQLLATASSCELHPPQTDEDLLPHPAIRSYPVQYVSTWTMKNGKTITLRPIRAADEPAMAKFNRGLSDRTVYLRYFQRVSVKTLTSHNRLSRVCFLDYDREFALLAELPDAQTGERKIVGVATLVKIPSTGDGEVAVLVSDECQGQGLGKELIARLVGYARDEGLNRVVASTMLENMSMCAVFERLGFQVTRNDEEEVWEAKLALN